jgi:SGS domain/CS domain
LLSSQPECEAASPETKSAIETWISRIPKGFLVEEILVPVSKQFPYSWFQTDERVVMEIKKQVSGVNDIKVVFDQKNVILKIKDKSGQVSEGIVHLFAEIMPGQCKSALGLLAVTLEMPKKVAKESWSRLEMSAIEAETLQGPKLVGGNQADGSGNYYPSSSKVKKDWSKLDKEIEKDLKKEGGLEEGDQSMKFFKEIFANADPETQKAMMKSYQTSGGTVL